MSEQWVLLWSQSQNAVHVERLEDCLSSNRLAYQDNRRSDCIPIFIGERGHVAAAAGHCCNTLLGRELGIEPLTRQPQEAA